MDSPQFGRLRERDPGNIPPRMLSPPWLVQQHLAKVTAGADIPAYVWPRDLHSNYNIKLSAGIPNYIFISIRSKRIE